MRVICADLPETWAVPVAEALSACDFGHVGGEEGAVLMLIGTTGAEPALARLQTFAATVPDAVRHGRDLAARAQAIWLLPEGGAAVLGGALRQAALSHAPALRVNGIAPGTPRPAPEPWQAAWLPARPCAQLPAPAGALAQALGFLACTPAVTGQILHLHARLR